MDSKLAKEMFVSGHSGTTLGEIYLLTATLISGYLLRCVLIVCVPYLQQANAAILFLMFLIEYITIVLPGILAFTVLSDYTAYVLIAITTTSCAVAVYHVVQNHTKLESVLRSLSEAAYPRRLPCITLTRTYVTLITAIAILAVDLNIFPRRLAKAEMYGTGLMDVGVGAFLMAHGLTTPEARVKKNGIRLSEYIKLVVGTLKSLLPLFVIGVLRLLAVKSTDYQEHVTEYGVHWNFFFTIAVVRLLCTLLYPLLNTSHHFPTYGLASILTALIYQFTLSQLGLTDYIVSGPHGDGSRPTLFSANREGICSCVGYLAIYMGHIEIGRWLFKTRKSVMEYTPVLLKLVCLSCVFFLCTVASSVYIEPVSRRIVNLAYICWIFSYGMAIVALFLLIDITIYTLSLITHTTLPSPYTSHPSHKLHVCIISSVDYNQLGFFLLANLLTGFVNFTIDTLRAGWVLSLCILIVYMATLVVVSVGLFKYRVKIKL